jgi:hypothetical protein
LHLLKLYSFYPAEAKTEVTSHVLLKALAAFPEPSFRAAAFLLPTASATTEPVKTLYRLDALLQTAQFEAFWTAVAAPDTAAIVAPVAGFQVGLITRSRLRQSLLTLTLYFVVPYLPRPR